MKSVITGSIAYDYLMSFPGNFSDHFIADKLDSISVSFLVDSLNKRKGGCAANIAYNLALLGDKPILFGAVGRDFKDYRADLEKIGVDTAYTKEFHQAYTASFFANSDKNGNQISSFYTGAMQYAKELSLEDFKNDKSLLVIISPNDPEAMGRYAAQCKEFGIDFIYDPGQQIVRLDGKTLKDCMSGAKLLILNDYEYGMLRKKTDFNDRDILDQAENVIITRGSKGADIYTTEGEIHIPVVKIDNIFDPTGIGDAFRAGLMKGLGCGLEWEEAGCMGSLAAAYVLETDGPQSHSYSIDEYIERYFENFGKSETVRRALSR